MTPPPKVVYPFLPNQQPAGPVYYPFAQQTPPSDAVFPFAQRTPPSDAVFPFAYMNSPVQRHLPTTVSPTTGEVYPFAYMIAAEQNNPTLRSLATPPSQGHPITRSLPLSPNTTAHSSPGMGTLHESTAPSWPTTAAEANTASGPRHSLLNSVAPSFPTMAEAPHSSFPTVAEAPYIRDPQPTLLTDLERQHLRHIGPSLHENISVNHENSPQYPVNLRFVYDVLQNKTFNMINNPFYQINFDLINNTTLDSQFKRRIKPIVNDNRTPENILKTYLHNNPIISYMQLVMFHVNWQYHKRPYPSWPDDYKKLLLQKFSHIIEIWKVSYNKNELQHNQLYKSMNVDPDKISFSLEEVQDVYLTYLAHSLLLDVYDLSPSPLKEYTSDVLEILLDSSYFYYSDHGSSNWKFGYPVRNYRLETPVNPIHPILVFYFLEKRGLINRSGYPQNPMGSYVGIAEAESQLQNLLPLQIYTWMNDISLPTTVRAVKRTISTISRWFQHHLYHGTGYGVHINKINPPLDRCLSLPIPPHRTKNYSYNFSNIAPKYRSKIRRSPQLLLNSDGTLASRIPLSDLDSPELVWLSYCAYDGCHTASGIMYWMLKSINIPSQIISTFELVPLDKNNPDPNDRSKKHGGIIVYIPHEHKSNGLCLHHMDTLYADNRSWDPVIDPLNYYVNQGEYNLWFGLPIPQTAPADWLIFEYVLYISHAAAYYTAIQAIQPSGWEDSFTKQAQISRFSPNYLSIKNILSNIINKRAFELIKGNGISVPMLWGKDNLGFDATLFQYRQRRAVPLYESNAYLRDLHLSTETLLKSRIRL